MKVLFVCSLGMSSAVAVKALEKEAKSKDIEIPYCFKQYVKE